MDRNYLRIGILSALALAASSALAHADGLGIPDNPSSRIASWYANLYGGPPNDWRAVVMENLTTNFADNDHYRAAAPAGATNATDVVDAQLGCSDNSYAIAAAPPVPDGMYAVGERGEKDDPFAADNNVMGAPPPPLPDDRSLVFSRWALGDGGYVVGGPLNAGVTTADVRK